MENASRNGRSDSSHTPASDFRYTNAFVQSFDQQRDLSDDSEVSDGDGAGSPDNGNKSRKPRSTHACQACRRMKIRCEPSEDGDSCKQCAKVHRECLVTEPRRKRQKTVHRVSELEKKIDALTASLQAKESVESRTKWTVSPKDSKPPDEAVGVAKSLLNEYSTARGSDNTGPRQPGVPQQPYVDVIDQGIVDQDSAYRAFQRYHLEMCHFCPIVVFPAATTAEEIRTKRPYLFLSILTAAISKYKADKQADLCDELTFILADKIIYRGERSLELVQALLVLMLHYSRPRHQNELNFNQIIHMAATMALDLGMGRRSKKGVFKESLLFPGVSVAETRRTWLGCYYMCASVAQSLRHPIFIRWSPYIEESLEYLSSSADALPSDAWLVDLVKVQHISEEVAFIFSMDDPAFVVSLADVKTQYLLKTFEREIAQWRKQSNTDLTKPWVRHLQEASSLYIHEIAIHFDHNIDDFRQPPQDMADESPANTEHYITPAHVDALFQCQESIHKMFDAFFEMDTETICNLPNLYFVKTAYAGVALIKMEEVLRSRGPKVGNLFDLKVEAYLQTTIDVLAKAAEGGRAHTAFGFGFVFRRLRSWYKNKLDNDFGPDGRGAGEPMMQDCAPQQLREAINLARKDYAECVSRGPIAPAASGPTTINEEESTTAPDMDMSYPFSYNSNYNSNNNNDTSLYSLGLPQFYDFGFTFDDAGLMGDPTFQEQGASGWYPTSISSLVGDSQFGLTK